MDITRHSLIYPSVVALGLPVSPVHFAATDGFYFSVMAIAIMSRVWKHSKQSGGTLLLLLALADFANEDTGECWPSVQTLAKKARVTDRHVRRLLRDLEQAGEIQCLSQEGQHGVNKYRVTCGEPPPPDKMSADLHVQNPDTGVQNPDMEVSQTIKEPKEPLTPSEVENELTLESGRFVEWFIELLTKTGAPAPRLTPSIRKGWADAYEKLRRIDGKSKDEIAKVCRWARADPFWSGNFYAPTKLRERKDGVSRYDLFLSRISTPPNNGHPKTQQPNGRSFSQGAGVDYDAIADRIQEQRMRAVQGR